MTPGRKKYLGVAIGLVFLGPLAAIGCFCPQPIPISHLGIWMIPGLAWAQTSFLVAHVLTGATYAVTWIAVLTVGIATAPNADVWLEHTYRVALIATGVVGTLAFGSAFAVERRRRAVDQGTPSNTG